MLVLQQISSTDLLEMEEQVRAERVQLCFSTAVCTEVAEEQLLLRFPHWEEGLGMRVLGTCLP